MNSAHIQELARQALFLVTGRKGIDTSGEMALNRYVELGTPLRLNVTNLGDQKAVFDLEQVGKSCATITLRW